MIDLMMARPEKFIKKSEDGKGFLLFSEMHFTVDELKVIEFLINDALYNNSKFVDLAKANQTVQHKKLGGKLTK